MYNDIDDKTFNKVRLYVVASLSPERLNHSERVADLSKTLCKKFGEDEHLGFFAGLCHDMCKEMDKKKLLKLAKETKRIVSTAEKKKPSLLHGMASSYILKNQFGIVNEHILEAIEYHTFGKKNMGNIAKIVCISDKIEPGRPYMTSVKYENLLQLSLDDMLFEVLHETVEKRRERNVEVFDEALWFYS